MCFNMSFKVGDKNYMIVSDDICWVSERIE